MTYSPPSAVDFYRTLLRIRRFEETVLENFSKGVFYGTTHTYLGQEANAAGILACLQPQDMVVSNHRCHGHFLAYGGDARALFAELMGKRTGVSGGRGGSQHLYWKNFYSNGILGGMLPLAAGMAFAEKQKGTQAVAVAFLGDGALGEGIVYETLNLASLWKAPLLFVVENNRIAQTTPLELNLAGSISARFAAFDIPTTELESHDVAEIHQQASAILARIRGSQSPQALILHTQRFGPHSKGDDTRPPDFVANLRNQFDPLLLQATRLPQAQRAQIEASVSSEIALAYQQALDDPFPTLAPLEENIARLEVA